MGSDVDRLLLSLSDKVIPNFFGVKIEILVKLNLAV